MTLYTILVYSLLFHIVTQPYTEATIISVLDSRYSDWFCYVAFEVRLGGLSKNVSLKMGKNRHVSKIFTYVHRHYNTG